MILSMLHFLFPPLCISCGEKCGTKLLCPDCWVLCELPDPISRCRHCFEALDERADLCISCRQKQKLSAPRAYVFDPESPARCLGVESVEAMAGFAILQWIELDWPDPDAVIPMPDSIPIAASFASFLNKPLIQALSGAFEYRQDRLEEGQILILFDISNPLSNLKKAVQSLSGSLPKKIYLLSLFPDIC